MKTRIWLRGKSFKSVDCTSFIWGFRLALQSFPTPQPSQQNDLKIHLRKKVIIYNFAKELTLEAAVMAAEAQNNEITENFSIELESNFDKLSFVFKTNFSFPFRLSFNYILISL